MWLRCGYKHFCSEQNDNVNGRKYREESWSWKHNSRRMKRKASIHGKAFYCLSSPTAHYLDHKICLSIFFLFFSFLPSLSPVSYPSYLFSAFLFSPLTAFYFTFSFSISFLSPFHPSHGLVTRQVFRIFRPSFTQIPKVHYHLVLRANLHTINNHHLPSNSNLPTISDHLLLSPNLLTIDNHCQMLTYSQLIIITCYQFLT